jgi:hypothetical protein
VNGVDPDAGLGSAVAGYGVAAPTTGTASVMVVDVKSFHGWNQ